ncbi:alpha/beta fold hydrolase [Proteiniphilum sp. X52]|uniref:alpha/beta fold hydrolase n=1 Tax=Proteiniphilum sp. X52 TaxID=2382159 RepID=UPI000F0A5082|nr:alpha/beta fold hydrolase [Proteiniphilum sp. X52]RNC65640.1 alpha/beta fold hydrolase [Proteiniphilum sp. X52]
MCKKLLISGLILLSAGLYTLSAKNNNPLRDSLEAVMGPLPCLLDLPPMNIQYKDSMKTTDYTRYTIRFTVAENEDLPAYLYLPACNSADKHPAMLVLHSTGDLGKGIVDGQGNLPNRAIAKELAERGYVVIAPDYPGFGDLKDYDFENDRYESGTMKGVVNHIRCVDLLQKLDQVDPDRIGVIGHSLGGHNALFVAAFDPRLKVVVSSCGWTQFEYYDIGPSAEKLYGGRLGPWAQDRYMPLIRTKYQLDQNKIPFNFHEIIALIAPRVFISNSPLNDKNFEVRGVREGIRKASVVYESLGVKENLKVFYPDSGHDFPLDIRNEIYQLIDKEFDHLFLE